jgi:hypothetical protein
LQKIKAKKLSQQEKSLSDLNSKIIPDIIIPEKEINYKGVSKIECDEEYFYIYRKISFINKIKQMIYGNNK